MQTSSLGKSMLRRGPCRVALGRPLLAGPASATFKYRKTAVVICAAPSKQESDGKVNSSMPRLPPRKKPQQPAPSTEQGKQAPKSSSSSSNRSRPKRLGSFAGGPNQPPPSESPQSVMQEKALAGLLAYTGLMGTVATAVAFFAPGVDLFGGFHWDAADVSLALKLMLPVYGLNLLIMLPNYSSWKLPEVTAESQAAMVEAIAKWSAKKGSKGSSSADASAAAGQHASTTAAGAVASEAPAADSAAAAAAQAASEPAASQQTAEQIAIAASSAPAAADAAPASRSVASSEAGTAESTPTPTSSSSTLGSSSSSSSSSEADDSWFSRQLKLPTVMRARDALYMAQGHYLSINPAVVLPLPLQATVLLIDCLAAELLYRSVALQLAGGWIGDRIVEAGADDVLDALLAGLPVLPTHASGQLVTVALLSVASGVVVLRNMRRMARRPQLALGAQGRQAAGQLLTDMKDKHRRQQRQQQQQEQQQKKTDNSSSSSSTAALEPASKVASSPDDKQQQQQQQDSASRAAADWAVAAAKEAAGSQEQQQQQAGPNLEPQWSRRIPSTLSGLALSQLVQGARDIGQMTALGLSFVLTGNLAAPFAAAVVNQALMSALQKRGLERARQRSIAMAKHLAGITRQLRDAQRKQEEKKRQQQQQGEEQQLLAASADPTQDAKPANAAAQGAPSASSDPLSSTAAAAVAASAAAAGASNAPDAAAPPPVLAAATAAAGEADPAAVAAAVAVPDAAAPAGEALVASRMERTIGVLDQLLGQLVETATAGPGPGK